MCLGFFLIYGIEVTVHTFLSGSHGEGGVHGHRCGNKQSNLNRKYFSPYCINEILLRQLDLFWPIMVKTFAFQPRRADCRDGAQQEIILQVEWDGQRSLHGDRERL